MELRKHGRPGQAHQNAEKTNVRPGEAGPPQKTRPSPRMKPARNGSRNPRQSHNQTAVDNPVKWLGIDTAHEMRGLSKHHRPHQRGPSPGVWTPRYLDLKRSIGRGSCVTPV